MCGSFIGVHLAMKHFRHKTQHISFKLIVSLSAILWIVILPWWYYHIKKNKKRPHFQPYHAICRRKVRSFFWCFLRNHLRFSCGKPTFHTFNAFA
ncbi:MAG: hypothetical protein SOX56_05655 [[Pasteurella] mairii]|nr:hypothetical protein [[Pasteurella] mairii]